MKRCSKCGRTYDESLTFCLEDGTVLSPPLDPPQTQRNSVRSTTEPPPTEVLNPKHPDEPTTKTAQPWFLYASIASVVLILIVVSVVWIGWTIANSQPQSPSPKSEITSNTPEPPGPSTVDISGSWRDGYRNTSEITQSGSTFRFTGRGTACRGESYSITGLGTISGSRIDLSYEGDSFRGQCSGTISAAGSFIQMNCVDSVCGEYFVASERVGRTGQ